MSKRSARRKGRRRRKRSAARAASRVRTPASPTDWRGEVRRRVEEILAPLVARDDGLCELAALEEQRVVLRFSGRCAGCPGFDLTTGRVAEPLLRPVLPDGVELHFERRASLPPRRGLDRDAPAPSPSS